MKKIVTFLILSSALSQAATETWTSKDGRSAEMELVKVTTEGTVKTGEFHTKAGQTVKLKSTDLATESAKRLDDWKAPVEAVAAGPSIFDKVLDGNLVKLEGKTLKRCTDATKPAKYYLFYYTASWCGPCHAFTPSLVQFYDAHKPKSNDFELVLITSDSDEKAMQGYAVEMKMNWPQLKMAKVEKFKKEFHHPGGGIPNLVLTDLDGKILKSSYEGTKYVGPTVVMDYLGTLLK